MIYLNPSDAGLRS